MFSDDGATQWNDNEVLKWREAAAKVPHLETQITVIKEELEAACQERDRWAKQCNLASEAQAEALSEASRLRRSVENANKAIDAFCQETDCLSLTGACTEIKGLRAHNAQLEAMTPSLPDRARLMQLCQDQGELTIRQRIEQVVDLATRFASPAFRELKKLADSASSADWEVGTNPDAVNGTAVLSKAGRGVIVAHVWLADAKFIVAARNFFGAMHRWALPRPAPLAQPRPDAPLEIMALPDWWDAQRASLGKDKSICAAELRLALARRASAPVVELRSVPGDLATPESTAAAVREFCEASTRIGNALGLEGKFGVHFGYQQMEQRANERNRDE